MDILLTGDSVQLLFVSAYLFKNLHIPKGRKKGLIKPKFITEQKALFD